MRFWIQCPRILIRTKIRWFFNYQSTKQERIQMQRKSRQFYRHQGSNKQKGFLFLPVPYFSVTLYNVDLFIDWGLFFRARNKNQDEWKILNPQNSRHFWKKIESGPMIFGRRCDEEYRLFLGNRAFDCSWAIGAEEVCEVSVLFQSK